MKKDFVSLAEERPDLAKEWNYEKNGDLKPEDVSCGSGKKVWWKLPYDVPDDYPVEHLRGKHFEFEWEAIICNRIKGRKCPFLSNQAIWTGFNDLQTTNPRLAKQWHPIKNGNLKPTEVTANSGAKVWWLLPYDDLNTGKHFEFEWQAEIGSRSNGNGCPFLSGKAVWIGFNDLATINKELATQWHPTKNGDLKPTQVTANTDKKVWWLYPYDDTNTGEHFEFEWEASIGGRNSGLGCPYLSGQAVLSGFNDLATINPKLAAQWHPIKNGDLKPTQVTANANKKVWWLLSYDDSKTGKHFDFEWEAIISSRNSGAGCPFFNGSAVWTGFNDLATINPELAAQWHPTKNGVLKPTQVTASTDKKVWWLLSYDDPNTGKHFEFEWEASINNRSQAKGCPYLTGHAVWPGFNDLATINPELAAQWHPTKNGDLKPTQVTANAKQNIWWIFHYDVPDSYTVKHLRGKHFDFEWQTTVANRNKNPGCPFLSGQALWSGFNDLQTVNEELAKQWHPTKNGNLKPNQIAANSNQKVWWILSYDVPMNHHAKKLRGRHFNFEWNTTCNTRNNGANCPYLTGHAVWPGFNDLQTTNPELAAQWHPTKNGNLKPSQVTANSNKKIWWMLQYDVPEDYPIEQLRGKHFNFEWRASISHRSTNIDCPFLSNRLVWKGFNDLQTVNPKLAKQWHPIKNGNLKPSQVTAHLNQKVWWLLSYDDIKTGKHFDFEWQATINSRVTQKRGCPYLTIYKGEEYIKQYLEKNNISFNVQQRFSDLRGTGDGQLSYDFSIPDEKFGCILIEYNGIQHYEANDFFGGEEQLKKQKEHDKRKRDYAKKHGYKLITVKYTYDTYESVEEYLDKELKKLGIIDDTKKEESVNDAA